jgi:molecular chaperone DnaK
VKTAFEKLSQSQGKLGEAIYAQSQQTADASANPGEDANPSGAAGDAASDEDVVDAEVIDDEDTSTSSGQAR